VNGTQYFYVVRSFNGSESASSPEATTLPMANFVTSSTSAPTASTIEVTWGAQTGAATYDVRYGTTSGTYTTTATNVTSPYTITGLAANTTYYIVVRANNTIGSGTSVTSSQTSQKTPTGAPTGLTASATPGSVGLNWTATAGATSYKIFRGTTSGSLTELATGVGTNAYMDTTVTNGVTYYYAVKSNNGADSALSAEVAIQPIASFSLTAVTATSSSTINLTFGSAAGATSYDVRYGTSPGVYLWTVANQTSVATITGLSSGTRYYFSIQAKNSVGSGTTLNSNEMNDITSLGAPTGLAASASPGSVALTWNALAGATSYKVYRGTISGSLTELANGVATASYTDSTVTNGLVYYYAVRAFNGTDSVNSSEVSVKPIASFTLTAATAASSTSIDVTWNSAAGADTYDIRYGTTSGSYTTTVSGVTSTHTLTGLTANTLYYVIVRANNAQGAGTTRNSNELNARTATAAPATLAITTTPGVASLTWSAATGATSYKIFRGTTSGIYSEIATGITATNYQDNSISNGVTYYFVVKAFNGADSANSNEASAQAISDFSITSTTAPSTSTIQVTWPAVTGAASYDVRYGTTTGSYTTTVTGVSSPYTISGLAANTLYYIAVRATNAVGAGSSTTSTETSQRTPVAAPTGLVATGGVGQVSLSWTAVSGV